MTKALPASIKAVLADIAQWMLPLAGLGAGVLALVAAEAGFGAVLAAVVLAVLALAAVSGLATVRRDLMGWASRVTQARLALVVVMAAALLDPALYREAGWILTGLALLALTLDGLDGFLARRLGECSDFGARFDMEVDAALILVLCLGVMLAGQAGPWVLLIGLSRYAFALAGYVWAWLNAPLPSSFRRKLVCVWQVVALLVAIAPVTGDGLVSLALGSALAGLVYSFAVDVRWLYRNGGGFCSQRGLT